MIRSFVRVMAMLLRERISVKYLIVFIGDGCLSHCNSPILS
jgi:hypothetical protein